MLKPDRASLLVAAGEMGVALDTQQADRLLEYLVLLATWNRTMNLTAIREPAAMFTHHLLDSLAVVAPLRRHTAPGQLLDVGSGAGVPGMVIAVAMPEVKVTCVDSAGKKVAFIRQAAAALGVLSLAAVHGRVQAMTRTFDVVTSRAFTSLAGFVEATRERVTPGGAWMAMKGRVPTEEVAQLPSDVHVFHVERLIIPGLSADRCLVWMRRS